VTREQRRAAELLGRGFSQTEVGRLVGRSERTIRNWQRDVAGFGEAVQAARAETSDPSALATLEQVLGASPSVGSPDWPTRVAAAKALLATPAPEPAPVVSVPTGGIVIYRSRLSSASRDTPRLDLLSARRRDRHPRRARVPEGGEGGIFYVASSHDASSHELARSWARDLRAGRRRQFFRAPVVRQ